MPDDNSFMEEEQESLKVHVQSCVRRHSEIRDDLRTIKRLLLGLIGVLVGGGIVTIDKIIPALTAYAAAIR